MSHASPRDASGWGHAVRVLEHRGPLFFSGLAETPERRKRFRLGSRTGRESFSRARVCWIRGSTFQPPEAEHTHIHERERNRASRSEAEGTRPMRRASPVERGVALGLPARRWVCRCSNMEEPNRRACARSGEEDRDRKNPAVKSRPRRFRIPGRLHRAEAPRCLRVSDAF